MTLDNLKACVKEKNPDAIFLMETKMILLKMTKTIHSLGFVNYEIVPAINKAGGLCLAWRFGVDMEVVSASKMAINAMVFSDPAHSPWLFSCVYGPPYKQSQYQFWDLLNHIGSSQTGPWLCLGNFNDISS